MPAPHRAALPVLAAIFFGRCRGTFSPGSVYDERRRFWEGTTSDRSAGAPAIKVGAPLSLHPSSKYYKYGTAYRVAYSLWFEWYADTYGGVLVNGTRRPVELLFMDDRSDVDRVTWVTEYMSGVEGIDLFLADYSSGLSRPMAEVINRTGKVMIAPNSASTGIFQNRWGCFSNQPPSAVYLAPAFEALAPADNAASKTVFTMYENTGAMPGICGGVATISTDPQYSGMQLLNSAPFHSISPNQEAQLDPVLDSWASSPPDVVVACFYSSLCYALLRKLWERKMSLKSIVLTGCTTGDGYLDEVGDAGQYILGTALWTANMQLSGSITKTWTSQQFASEFELRYKLAPPYQAASAFVAAATLTHAIESANSVDPVQVAAAMQGIAAESMIGTIAFDGNGQTTNRMKIVQFQQSQYSLTVHPAGPNSVPMVYPIPSIAMRACLDTVPTVDNGYGYLNGLCTVCPLGKKSAVTNSTNATQRICQDCAPGLTGALSGGRPSCLSCNMGYYSALAGATSCEACTMGFYGPIFEASSCTPCAAGKHTKVPGAIECLSCEAGNFQNESQQSTCHRCPMGMYSTTEAATACEACLPSFTTQGTGFDSAAACGCPENFFDQNAWDPSRPKQCIPCPAGVKCPGFKARLMLKPGYSASVAEFNPLKGVWECMREALCPGGPPGTCFGGHQDVACSLCPDGWVPNGPRGECQPCTGGTKSIFYIVVAAGVLLITPIYYVTNGEVTPETRVKLGGSITVGLVITTVQILGMVSRMNVPWPDSVAPSMSGASIVLFEEGILGMPCSIGRSPSQSYFIIFLLPFAFIAVFGFLSMASYVFPLLTRGKLQKWNPYKAFNTLCNFGQMGFITLTSIAVVPMQCFSHPAPNKLSSLVKYPSVMCDFQGQHMGMLVMGIVIIALLVVPFMILCFWGSYRAFVGGKETGMESNLIKMYRFLIFRFRPMVWWWGNVFNIRQLLLGFTPMIAPDDPGMQVLYIVLVLLPYLMLLQLKLPWRTPELNMADGVTTTLLTILIVGVSAFLPPTEFADTHAHILAVVLALLLAVLVGMVLYLFYVATRKGLKGMYGVPYPADARVDGFADTFRDLCKKVAALPKEDHRQMVTHMSSIECMDIDKVMAILVAHGIPISEEASRNCHTKTLSLTTQAERDVRSEEIGKHYKSSAVVQEDVGAGVIAEDVDTDAIEIVETEKSGQCAHQVCTVFV